MDQSRTAKVIEWDQDRGFGFLEGDSPGDRIFLHVRQIEGGVKPPRKGDRITFSMGTDPRGRPQAVHATNRRKLHSMGWSGYLELFLLLILPYEALTRLASPLAGALVAYFVLLASATAYVFYQQDKLSACGGQFRISEVRLHVLEMLGGWIGAFVAQRHFRHKCTKCSYQFFFWTIVVGHQIFAIDVLRCGEVSFTAWSLLQSAFKASLAVLGYSL